jgi:hypothetical protein
MNSHYLRFNYQNTDPNHNYKIFIPQDDFDPSAFIAEFSISQLPFEAISLRYRNYHHSFINLRDNYERLIMYDEFEIYDGRKNNEKVNFYRFLAPFRAEYYTFQSNSYYTMKIRRAGFDIHEFMKHITFSDITPHDEYLTLISHNKDYDIEQYDRSFHVELNISIILRYEKDIIFMNTSKNPNIEVNIYEILRQYIISNTLKKNTRKSVLEYIGFPQPNKPNSSLKKSNRKRPLQLSKNNGGKRKHLKTKKRR